MNRHTIGAATAVLVLAGGAAYAYVADRAQAQGSGNVAHGTLTAHSVTVHSPVILGVPQQVTMQLVATGQVFRVHHVNVVAAPTWPQATCGNNSYFHGVDEDLPSDVYVSPGHPVWLDGSNASNIKVTLDSDPGINQANCAFPIKVTVS